MNTGELWVGFLVQSDWCEFKMSKSAFQFHRNMLVGPCSLRYAFLWTFFPLRYCNYQTMLLREKLVAFTKRQKPQTIPPLWRRISNLMFFDPSAGTPMILLDRTRTSGSKCRSHVDTCLIPQTRIPHSRTSLHPTCLWYASSTLSYK
jgi:hypothetical protein